MARLLYSNAGKMAVIRGAGLPAVVSFSGTDGGKFVREGVIITQVGLSQSCNVQIQPSLRKSIYIYAFGDSMGSISIGGTSFVGELCGGGVGKAVDGIEEVLKFYAANRVSKSVKHVTIAIGRTVFSGFLMSMQSSNTDSENRLFSWTMVIAALPNFDGLAEGGNGNDNGGGGGAAGASGSGSVSPGGGSSTPSVPSTPPSDSGSSPKFFTVQSVKPVR